MRTFLLLATALLACSELYAQSEAESGREIQGRLDEAIRAGGGEVVIPAGVHTLERGLILKNARHLRITAAPGGKAVLRLGPLAFAEASGEAPVGASEIAVSRAQNLKVGMRLKLECDGEPNAFTGKPTPYQVVILKAIEPTRLLLQAPLKFKVPSATFIRHEDAPNLIEIRGTSDDVRIEGLVLDGGRRDSDPPVHGHAQLCAIFAAGPYDYEKGPTGPLVKSVQVIGCQIRECFGRGVAFYAVGAGVVEDNVISGTNDEAVDLDHFTVGTVVRHNRMQSCGVGVELNDANDCLVEENEMRACQVGLNVWRWCKQPGLNEHNQLVRNGIFDSKGNGVQIASGTAANLVADNLITGAGRNGISLGGTGQTVTGNRIGEVKLKSIAINEGEHTLRDNQ